MVNVLNIVDIAFPLISLILIGLRVAARTDKRSRLFWDDYTIILAWIFSLGTAITTTIGVCAGGIGTPEGLLWPDELAIYLKVAWAQQFLFMSAVSLVRTSILLFYKQLFATARFALWANIMLGVVGAWLVAFFFATLFHGWPHDNPFIDYPVLSLVLGITDLALDLIVLCLPMPITTSIQVTRRRRFGVASMFGLGFLCVVASAVRIYYPYVLYATSQDVLSVVDSGLLDCLIWSQIEVSWSVICACLPTLSPLFRGDRNLKSKMANLCSIFKPYTHRSNLDGENTEFEVMQSSTNSMARLHPSPIHPIPAVHMLNDFKV